VTSATKWHLSFCHRPHARGLARSGPAQCRRHKSARSTMGLNRSLSRVQHTNPGLARSQDKAQIEAELRRRIDVSSREVSKDGGSTARRRPNLSITGSMCRQPLLRSLTSKTRALFLRSLRSLASFAPSTHEDAFLSATPFSKLRAPFFLSFLPFVPRARLSRRLPTKAPPLRVTSSF